MIKTLTASTIALGLLCVLMTDVAAAQSERNSSSAEVALSNDTFQLRYETGGSPLGVDDGRLFGAFFLSEERDIVISAGLSFPAVSARGIRGALGEHLQGDAAQGL